MIAIAPSVQILMQSQPINTGKVSNANRTFVSLIASWYSRRVVYCLLMGTRCETPLEAHNGYVLGCSFPHSIISTFCYHVKHASPGKYLVSSSTSPAQYHASTKFTFTTNSQVTKPNTIININDGYTVLLSSCCLD